MNTGWSSEKDPDPKQEVPRSNQVSYVQVMGYVVVPDAKVNSCVFYNLMIYYHKLETVLL